MELWGGVSARRLLPAAARAISRVRSGFSIGNESGYVSHFLGASSSLSLSLSELESELPPAEPR